MQIDDIKDVKWEYNYTCILNLKDNRRCYEQFYANEFENLEINFKYIEKIESLVCEINIKQ